MKIGFIDYYLDEFHANNYPKWIKNALAEGETSEFYAWAEIDSPHGDRTTEQWCADNGVTRLGTMREVCETCDFLFLLSPDDPQNHLPYAETVLPYQKPVFIDKTFAPDTATAKQIIALAEKHNTPFFSSSSLRFAKEYADISHKARSVIAHGSGWNFEVELIHPIEICACLVGNGAVAVSVCGNRDQFVAELRYPDDRQGAIHYTHRCEGLDYGATVVWEDYSERLGTAVYMDNSGRGLTKHFPAPSVSTANQIARNAGRSNRIKSLLDTPNRYLCTKADLNLKSVRSLNRSHAFCLI